MSLSNLQAIGRLHAQPPDAAAIGKLLQAARQNGTRLAGSLCGQQERQPVCAGDALHHAAPTDERTGGCAPIIGVRQSIRHSRQCLAQ